jgi:hypothetical protein
MHWVSLKVLARIGGILINDICEIETKKSKNYIIQSFNQL